MNEVRAGFVVGFLWGGVGMNVVGSWCWVCRGVSV